MGALTTNPAATHFSFPYFFDNTQGINFNSSYLYYDGDMLLYYDNQFNDTSPKYIDCWCSRWDTSEYSLTLETWLKRSDVQTLQNNVKPGAVGELYKILDRPTYYDKTWSGDNTLMIVPNNYTSREIATNTPEGNNRSYLPSMRSTKIIYVKNLTFNPVEGSKGFINTKIEGYISGTTTI